MRARFRQARWSRSGLLSFRRQPARLNHLVAPSIDKLRVAASDLGVEFHDALAVSCARSDVDVSTSPPTPRSTAT